MKRSTAVVFACVLSVALLAPPASGAAAGGRCTRLGQTAGGLECAQQKSRLVWVRKPVTPTCASRTVEVGRADGTNELMPGGTRLRSAISSDGVTWTRLQTTIADRAATPSLVMREDGRPLLLATGHRVDGAKDGIVASVGSADGRSWTHCQITRLGFPPGLLGVDPDVVALPTGGYRMFVTGGDAPGSARVVIHYAESLNGFDWTYGGIALSRETSTVDSMTFRVGDTWHMYALDGTSPAMVYATSDDGRHFHFVDSSRRDIDGMPHVLSHTASVAGITRLYAFGPRGRDIRSFTTKDGAQLVGETRSLLTIDGAPAEEYLFVKDPAVVRLTSNEYLMVYATALRPGAPP